MVLAIYVTPLALIVMLYLRRQRAMHASSVSLRDAAIAEGMTEPASLHPVIDPLKCIGCAACVSACPEMPGHKVLGLIHKKAELINPTDCIGHGACMAACPADAITLVFGTERRGIDIPQVAPNFETNQPGIFIAGELGGMGLIRNAIEQGCQAIDSIQRLAKAASHDELDVLIVGAGPAGFAATLAAHDKALRYATLEQDTLGGTVAHFPRGKLVMTAPARLPLYGEFRFRETRKEDLLAFWTDVERQTRVRINYNERVESITRTDQGFAVKSSARDYRTRTVLLAIGRRGTPRKLEVPGEDLAKVTYRLIDPEQYRDQKVLVVGGGDSALEAACSIAEVPGSSVTLSYRSATFTRAKPRNRERAHTAAQEGLLQLLLQSTVQRIDEQEIELIHNDQPLRIPNDAVIISAGGILPTDFLRDIGIHVETKYGEA